MSSQLFRVTAVLLLLLPLLLQLSTVVEGTDESTKASVRKQPIWNDTDTDRLRRDLLTTYDPFSRPSPTNETTDVVLGMNVKNIELDDSKSVFRMYGWITMVCFE